MTWAQVATLVATVFIAVIVGLVYNDRRLSDLRADMAARFATMDARFATVDARFATVDTRFTELRSDINTRFAEIHADLHEIRALLQEALRTRA